MIKKLLKLLGYSLLSIAIFIGYAFWAEESEIYRCEGQGRHAKAVIEKAEAQIGEVDNPYLNDIGFLKIESFTKISLIWADGRHHIWWEKADGSTDIWTNVAEVGEQLRLNDDNGHLEGVFSQISKSFSVVTGTREFKGMCKKVEQ
ncbi:hypothetical protein N2382_10420 [SAR92 clade bacterium H921]|nr:hypothetical protein [SAR92 clade bacterium H921]